MGKSKILVIKDERKIAEIVRTYLGLTSAFLERNVVFMVVCESVQSLFYVVTILAFFQERKKEIR